MRAVMVRYKTESAHAPRNAELVRLVFEELRALAPSGFHYSCCQLDDGATFVHWATMASPADNPLVALPAFRAFQEGLAERCTEPPVVTTMAVLASFGPPRSHPT